MFILGFFFFFVSSDPVDHNPVKMKRPDELIDVDPPAPAIFGIVCSSAGSPFSSHTDSSSSLGVPAPSNYDLDLRYIIWEYSHMLPCQDKVTYASHPDEPNTYWNAKACEEAIAWELAMNVEILALMDNHTWDLTTLPPDCTAIKKQMGE